MVIIVNVLNEENSENFLDVIGDVTDFIIGKEIDEEYEKEKVFGFNLLLMLRKN